MTETQTAPEPATSPGGWRVTGLNAEWLWQLARVSERPKSATAGTDRYARMVRIEPRDGRPILVATDGVMLTAIHATEARCEGLDQPITLRVDGALRREMGKLGAERRYARTVALVDRPRGGLGVQLTGISGGGIWRGPDAEPLVLRGDDAPFPAWRRAVPRPERTEGSWARVGRDGIARINGLDLRMLDKVPRLGCGTISIQPVWEEGAADRDRSGRTTTLFVIREIGLEDRAFTLVMPTAVTAPLDLAVPEFGLPPEDGPAAEAAAEAEGA